MSAPLHSACRSFEERLPQALDAWEDRSLDGLPIDPHAASCASCAALIQALRATSILKTLRAPLPTERFAARLRALPADFAVRRAVAVSLELLESGALARPEPSPELMGRLLFMPTRARAAAREKARAASGAAGARGRWKPLLSDWRFTVAVAYAATLVLVVILQIDPLSAARGAASDLTAVGERALSDARSAAVARLEDSALGRATKPFTERLDYRIYRTLTAGRARATAYSQMVVERLFGGAMETSAEARPKTDEPAARSLRS
jgi:hypothetical protein